MQDKTKIEERLKNMKKVYLKVGDLVDSLPDSIPNKTKDSIKDAILGDKELKELMDGIDSHRPPRIFLMGRTGVGKSSLVNAICGAYVAKVSDTVSCTPDANTYQVFDGERLLMEVLDTRGIAESDSIDAEKSAEDALVEDINHFSPDVAIFMLNCTHRDDVNKDVEFIKKVAKEYEEKNTLRLPVVVVINKCDEMAPSRKKDPDDYPISKIEKINEVVKYYKGIIVKNGLKIDGIIPVSSLIDWQTPDGLEVAVEDIENLPEHDIENLQIAFDGRYRIEDLLDILEDAILDCEAQMGLRMAARLNEVVKRIAKHLIHVFATISATVALSPIPVSDIYILLLLQALLVLLIAALSGREITLDAAKEFVLGMGGVAGAGYTFRLIAQQGAKLINLIWPAAGSAVSSGIAATGTEAIGKAAVAYYLDEKSIAEAKAKFQKESVVTEK